MSKYCTWWILVELAVKMAGLVTVLIYPAFTEITVQYILEHSESKLCFVGKFGQGAVGRD